MARRSTEVWATSGRRPRRLLPPRAQSDVDPAREEVQGVPLALAVAEQDQSVAAHSPPSLPSATVADEVATAVIILENSVAFRLAPPTRHPSQLGSRT